MTEHKLLDAAADVLPVGLQPTPFGDVWRALQEVAADVWNVDPTVYRAGIAWLWYALRNPAALNGLRQLLAAALISEQAPLVKDTQTAAELAEYIRLWNGYTPTFPKLEALYGVFAADVEILPITAPEYAPVAPTDTKLAFFVIIRSIDFSRPLLPDEAELIAIRATPMGARPRVVTELTEDLTVTAYPVRAGVPSVLIENDAVCEPAPEPTYEEMMVWVRAGLIQPHVTNSLGGGGNTHAGAVATNVHYLYADNSMLNQIMYQAGKRYEFGSYQGSTWVKYRTTIPEMPASTTSDVSTTQYGFIPYEDSRGYLCCWYVSNYTNTMSWGERSLRMRIYDDVETEVTVYKDSLQYIAQTSVSSSSIPASAFLSHPLYIDSSRTVKMPYDNTKKYKFGATGYYTLDEFLASSNTSTTLIINNNGFAYAWRVTKSTYGTINFNSYDQLIKIADV